MGGRGWEEKDKHKGEEKLGSTAAKGIVQTVCIHMYALIDQESHNSTFIHS